MTGAVKLSEYRFGCLAALAVMAGCSQEGVSSSNDSPRPWVKKMEMSKETIEASAISDVMNRTSLKANELKAVARQDGEDWRVTVIRLPETPGAFYTIVTSKTGDVKDFVGGE